MTTTSRRRTLPATALLGTALVLGAGTAAAAQEGLAPGQAHLPPLGEVHAVSYYTVEPDGAFRVVTTIATGAKASMAVRSVAVLRPGQATTISVPGAASSAAAELVLERRGDRLMVGAPRRQTAALR